MNPLVIQSAADVDRFVNETMKEDYQFRLLHKDEDVIFIDVLIASKIIQRLLHEKIASSRWANLVVLPVTAVYSRAHLLLSGQQRNISKQRRSATK